MDPTMIGMMLLQAAQNPQMAPALDQAGIPPPMGLGAGAGAMGPLIDPWQTTVTPAAQAAPPAAPAAGEGAVAGAGAGAGAAAPGAGGMNPAALMAMAGMQGVKAPAPIQPIMHGGVTGGVKAPDANVQAMQGGSQGVNALIQAMLQRQNPLAVPALGDFIRGRGGY